MAVVGIGVAFGAASILVFGRRFLGIKEVAGTSGTGTADLVASEVVVNLWGFAKLFGCSEDTFDGFDRSACFLGNDLLTDILCLRISV